jgi:hypothetical protein
MTPFKIEIAFLVALLFVLSSGVIWIRTANVRTTYEYVQRESELKTLLDKNQDLRIQWTKLTSPQKLKVLSAELNMNPPKLHQVFSLGSSRKAK